MRNQETWKPTKYRLLHGTLRASTDSSNVKYGSRLIVECIAHFYNRAIPQFASGRLIDLGCGKAPLFLKYQAHVSSTTCVDWGNTVHKNDNLDIECDLAQKLPFDDGSFDTIILSDVLEHLPEPALLWEEMNRILSPGGRLLMNVPYFYPLHELPYDYYRYSCYALRRFAESHGFEVIEITALGGSPEVMTDIIAKHLQFVPIVGGPLAKFIQFSTLWFVHTGPGRRLSNKTSEHYPLGYSMVAQKN